MQAQADAIWRQASGSTLDCPNPWPTPTPAIPGAPPGQGPIREAFASTTPQEGAGWIDGSARPVVAQSELGSWEAHQRYGRRRRRSCLPQHRVRPPVFGHPLPSIRLEPVLPISALGRAIWSLLPDLRTLTDLGTFD